MNLDPLHAQANGSSASPSVFLPNGGCSESPYTHARNDLSFHPGGIPSLQLPVVVVLTLDSPFTLQRIIHCKCLCSLSFAFLEYIFNLFTLSWLFQVHLFCLTIVPFIFSDSLVLPLTFFLCKQVSSLETSLVARCRRVYTHAHDYHINSISNNRFIHISPIIVLATIFLLTDLVYCMVGLYNYLFLFVHFLKIFTSEIFSVMQLINLFIYLSAMARLSYQQMICG